MSRRDARTHAFYLVFQFPFHNPFTREALAEAYSFHKENLPEDIPVAALSDFQENAYAERVVNGVFSELETIDGVINKYLKDWALQRINRVDLAILRLSVYELLFEPGIPAGATINEAVELAKLYGADESPAFINGVLGGVSRDE